MFLWKDRKIWSQFWFVPVWTRPPLIYLYLWTDPGTCSASLEERKLPLGGVAQGWIKTGLQKLLMNVDHMGSGGMEVLVLWQRKTPANQGLPDQPPHWGRREGQPTWRKIQGEEHPACLVRMWHVLWSWPKKPKGCHRARWAAGLSSLKVIFRPTIKGVNSPLANTGARLAKPITGNYHFGLIPTPWLWCAVCVRVPSGTDSCSRDGIFFILYCAGI